MITQIAGWGRLKWKRRGQLENRQRSKTRVMPATLDTREECGDLAVCALPTAGWLGLPEIPDDCWVSGPGNKIAGNVINQDGEGWMWARLVEEDAGEWDSRRMLGSDSRRSSFEDNFIEMSGKHQAVVRLAAKCIGPNFRAECLSEDTNMWVIFLWIVIEEEAMDKITSEDSVAWEGVNIERLNTEELQYWMARQVCLLKI